MGAFKIGNNEINIDRVLSGSSASIKGRLFEFHRLPNDATCVDTDTELPSLAYL